MPSASSSAPTRRSCLRRPRRCSWSGRPRSPACSLRLSALVFALGSAIAAVPACLILVKDGGTAYMGFLAVFMGFVAVVVGGIGSLRGAVAGGYALGLVESLGLWKIPSEWQNTIAFVVLFMVLLFRPQGLFAGRQ